MNDAWSVPSVFTFCTKIWKKKKMLTHPFLNCCLTPGTWSYLRVSCCYSMSQIVPPSPRELFVLFVKYYLIVFVSKKNKCSHWSVCLAVVFTSQKANEWNWKLQLIKCIKKTKGWLLYLDKWGLAWVSAVVHTEPCCHITVLKHAP